MPKAYWLAQVEVTDAEGYKKYFGSGKLDAIVNTGNSFCHLPPNQYMDAALSTFYDLLRSGGVLIIDTKKFSKGTRETLSV